MAPNRNTVPEVMTAVPAHQRDRIVAGMRWTLWLSVMAVPFSYGTNIILARVGPEVIGTYGLLSVYVGIVTAFLYLGGDQVAIKFIPELSPGQRPSFLGSYFLVICLGLIPWIVAAAIWPQGLRYLFGEHHDPSFHILILSLSPVCILSYLAASALKGMLEMQWAQVLLRLVSIGSFLLYAALFIGWRSLLSLHYTEVIWAIYLILTAWTAALGLRQVLRLNRPSHRLKFLLPKGFWRYTFATQQVGLVWFFIQRMDYVLILNLGGLELLGRYVAIASIAMLIPLVNSFFIDALLPSLTTLVASGSLAAASQVFTVHMRIVLIIDTALTCGLLLFAGPVTTVLGPQYVPLRSLLMLMVLLVGVASPGVIGGNLLASVGKQQRAVWVGVGQVGLYVLLFLALWPKWQLRGAVLAYGIAMLLSYALLLGTALRAAQMQFSVVRDYAVFGLVTVGVAVMTMNSQPLPIIIAVGMWAAAIGFFLMLSGYSVSECLALGRCLLPWFSDTSPRRALVEEKLTKPGCRTVAALRVVPRKRLRIIHVEVGGRYGGSVRALELYLTHSDRAHLEHEILFYYPSECADRLRPWVQKIYTLYEGQLVESRPTGSVLRITLQTLVKRVRLADAIRDVRCCGWLALRLPAVWRLSRLLRAGAYDVVHVNNTLHYQPLALLAARLAGIPVIAHIRNPVPSGLLSRTLMRLSSCIVTVNLAFEQQLRGWGVPVPIRTCRDGLLLEPPDENASSKLRQSLAPPHGFLVGSAGRLDEQKGYDTLIRAARLVVDERPDVYFAIAGEGPLFSPLVSLISALEIDKNVRLCGFRADIQNFLFALDLFVNSSNWEGLPLSLMEAMLLGKPVIATDVGGNSEVVRPGVTGELVPKGDPKALAHAILAAINDWDRLLRAARTSHEQVANLTDPQRTAGRFEDVLKEHSTYHRV